MEPFWDLKIGRVSAGMMNVSSEYYKLSATFSDKYRRPNFTCSIGWRNPVDR